MTSPIEIAFERDYLKIPLDNLVPSKSNPKNVRATTKFQQIVDSIKDVGLVEPIAVHPIRGDKGRYLVLDGHLRLLVLKDQGETEVECLIATDDEAFTYNKRINRISSVQEHYMILKAVKNGVSEKRIAAALGINVETIRRKRSLLDGICPEVVEMVKHKSFPVETARVLRKLTPIRQIEVAELMMAANNMSVSYAKALYMATNPSQLRDKTKKTINGLSEVEREKMEREMESIQRDVRAVEENYGVNMLRLVVASGYIGRLLENKAVTGYLNRHHRDLLEQLLVIQDSIDADVGIAAE